jgi:hypothetical protein
MGIVERTAFVPEGDYTLAGECVFVDVDGLALNGSHRRYALRLETDWVPDGGFWSITMYDGDSMSLVDNVLHRHAVHSSMQEALGRDPDGTLTIWLQGESPGRDRAANWLPTPNGPFYMVFRVFLPVPEYLSPVWKRPTVRRR